MTEQKRTDIRSLAHSALMMINEEDRLSHIVVREALDKYDFLSARDKAMFHRLVNGTLEYQNTIDDVIDGFSKVKTAKMKPYVRNLIRMGVYQLLFMDRIPDSAACDEAVKMIRSSALKGLGGFVNGLLRNISRHKSDIALDFREARYSVKKWMLDELDATIGKEAADSFLEDSLKQRDVYVRSDTEAFDPIEAAGIRITDMYKADDPDMITKSSQWKEGHIYIQDISSTMPVRLAGISEGMTVLDVCAAPGGKAVQAAQMMHQSGKVIACDISEKKADLIRENAARTGCKNMEVRVCDAAEFHEAFSEMADVVIADLPCSGIGTISHKPDIKNRLSHEDVLSLAALQQRILDNVCRYVKPGGKLIYSTCTLTHEENADNVAAFSQKHPEFIIKRCVTMLPCKSYSCDGFYICVMERAR